MTIRTFGTVLKLTNQPIGLDVGAGINTGDATATVADLTIGKTAYGPAGKLTGTGSNAKLYATGTTTSSAGTLSFTKSDGTTASFNYVTVSGLNFPSGIAFIAIYRATFGDYTIYDTNNLFTTGNSKIAISFTSLYYQLTGNATVSTSGFQIPVAPASALHTYEVWGA
jgi:hypothetical protein